MSDKQNFPLDAEQIVRGIGFLSALWLNRARRPSEAEITTDMVTIALAQAMGVPMPTEEGRLGRPMLLPYGAAATEPKPSSDPREKGRSDAA